MHILKRTTEFDQWLVGLRDPVTRIRLARRLDKAIALSRTLEE